MAAELQFSDVELVSAITSTKGNFSRSAEILGVSRGAVQRRVRESEEIKSLVTDLREGRIDTAESNLDKAVQEGEPWAVQFFLKTQGKSRGYYERNEVAILMEQLRAIEDALNERGPAIGTRADQPALLETGHSVTDDADL